MVVECPKCNSRLRVADEKIAPQGSRFKCPKCAGVLLVKRPVEKPALLPKKEVKELDLRKAIVAHGDPSVVEKVKSVLSSAGYVVITATDGVDMIIKTLKELPHLALVDVALPKIYGFEVCKRLRVRPETKDMKMILISSIYDKKRYRREPVSLYGADAYIDEHKIEENILMLIESLKEPMKVEPTLAVPPPGPVVAPPPVSAPSTAMPEAPSFAMPETQPRIAPVQPRVAPPPVRVPPPPIEEKKPEDTTAERARRFVRAMLSDVYLYSAQKVENAIRNNNFRQAFAREMNEGLKIYENRISLDVRSRSDYFNEEIDKFIEIRKKSLGL